MISIKTEEEIELLKASNELVSKTLAEVARAIGPGVTTLSLDRIAESFIRDHKGIPGFLGYNGFPATLCTSVNDEVVHGIPSDYELREGDILSVDWDPVEVIRQPDSDPGQLHIDIGAGRIVLSVRGQNTFNVRLPEANELSFSIQLENETISITLNEQELCPPTGVEFPPGEGRISFSGRGRLDNILVLQR